MGPNYEPLGEDFEATWWQLGDHSVTSWCLLRILCGLVNGDHFGSNITSIGEVTTMSCVSILTCGRSCKC